MNKVPKETPHFICAVKDQFNFLSNCAFRLTETKGSTVRFESSTVYIIFSYQWYTYEIDMEIGKTGDHNGYSFSEVVNAIKPDYKYSCGKIASKRESIDAILTEYAHFIQDHGKSLISGDSRTFDVLEGKRSESLRKSERWLGADSLRKKAERSWQQKNYVEVQKLYKTIKYDLTETEQKRLKYASRKIQIKDQPRDITE